MTDAVSVKQDGGRYRLVGEPDQQVADANKFLSALEVRGLSPHTVRAYAYDLAIFLRWLAAIGKSLSELEHSDLFGLIEAQRADNADPHSINRRLTTCRSFYRFWAGHDLEPRRGSSLPSPHFAGRGRERSLGIHKLYRPQRLCLRVKVPRTLVEPLTTRQVRAFFRTLRRYRDISIAYFLLLCGLRSAEVLSLKLQDVALEEQHVRVRGKGNKERMLPLPNLLAATIGDYLRLERPALCLTPNLFVVLQGRRRGSPMSATGMRSLFRQRRLKPQIANANPHRFRHTFGADMARAGVRLPVLQKMMGHTHAHTTLQYINLSMTDIAAEFRRAIAEVQKRYAAGSP
jgi:site-specific recombinase XerD